jgi:hypothetical protein
LDTTKARTQVSLPGTRRWRDRRRLRQDLTDLRQRCRAARCDDDAAAATDG